MRKTGYKRSREDAHLERDLKEIREYFIRRGLGGSYFPIFKAVDPLLEGDERRMRELWCGHYRPTMKRDKGLVDRMYGVMEVLKDRAGV